jgi:hypothetical protein
MSSAADRSEPSADDFEALAVLTGATAHDLRGILSPLGLSLDLLEGHLPTDPSLWQLVKEMRSTLRAAVETTYQLSNLAHAGPDSPAIIDARYLLTEQQKRLEPRVANRIAVATECSAPALFLVSRPATAYRGLADLCERALRGLASGALVMHAASRPSRGARPSESGRIVQVTVASWSAPLDEAFERLDGWIAELESIDSTTPEELLPSDNRHRGAMTFLEHIDFPAHVGAV